MPDHFMDSCRERLAKLAFTPNEKDLWVLSDAVDSSKSLDNEKSQPHNLNYSNKIWKVADWLSKGSRLISGKDLLESGFGDDEAGLSYSTHNSMSHATHKSQGSGSSKYRFGKFNRFSTNSSGSNNYGGGNNNYTGTGGPGGARSQRQYGGGGTSASSHNTKRQAQPYRSRPLNYNRCQYKWFLKPSIQLKEAWEEMFSFEFSKLAKIRNKNIPSVKDIMWCGVVNGYNTSFDSVKRNAIPLKREELTQFSVAASEDPIIRQHCGSADIFTTDIVIATLMTCIKSLASWHIAITKIGEIVFLDKRHESGVDLSFVCENGRDPPFDFEINSPMELALEATRTRQRYAAQCTLPSTAKALDHPDPFTSSPSPSSVAYRYRLFTLPGGSRMLVRCEHDAHITDKTDNTVKFVDIYTLLQWSQKLYRTDWRNKFSEQSGSVLASEIKFNNNKVARWTATTILSGTDQVKIGFISRENFKNNKTHCIVGSTTCKPGDLASMIDFSYENSWGVVYHILEHVKKLTDGTYILIKVPLKNMLKVYRTPDSNLPSEDDDLDVDMDDNCPIDDDIIMG